MNSMKTTILALASFALLAPEAQAQSAPWVFGLGTGIGRMSTDGTMGFVTSAFGPVENEIDLSPDDVQDLFETGFGFATVATNGTWTAKLSYGRIKLGDEATGTLDAGFGGFDYAADAFWDIKSGEFTLGRTVYRSPGNGFALTPHVGARYTKHEVGLDMTVMGGIPTELIGVEENWTDVLVGTSLDFVLSPKWTWGTVLNAGFGGSEGTYKVATALSWKPASHWVISPNASFTTTEFENGTRGDSDWYLYDSDDSTVGLAVMYLFF